MRSHVVQKAEGLSAKLAFEGPNSAVTDLVPVQLLDLFET